MKLKTSMSNYHQLPIRSILASSISASATQYATPEEAAMMFPLRPPRSGKLRATHA
jgi:hypothetical protein